MERWHSPVLTRCSETGAGLDMLSVGDGDRHEVRVRHLDTIHVSDGDRLSASHRSGK